ncbi:hypothetical protein PHYBLDRAFT_59599 [Phycomyces blakesleeanus NRRL 1555(-)]|uniref:Uncharacterized protein n=1 Tax=Phycomyces blakesleeanus (strain ATCC 8743b / DSM 1359 / FGSC 10004 / NBRC 33097 / NRRL 1555) TaxID=763407 RepID=A0A167NJG7_PHYB8|nr:hypothetical protein PHYBLDRAFT_59599 [Phycomyces blakesleeanus NRRL 1555(-)]OAD76068.1 hypothetical protein PHYBLDRAFT_59599 [Phycomyces blakesleeanus NRRL 1555(-)]|eukprot:XP_018294108.1 hypothetical protein PHYBLDRAFT_59599 [Phycomyces blakesleeanus NRRL 1555(-)]
MKINTVIYISTPVIIYEFKKKEYYGYTDPSKNRGPKNRTNTGFVIKAYVLRITERKYPSTRDLLYFPGCLALLSEFDNRIVDNVLHVWQQRAHGDNVNTRRPNWFDSFLYREKSNESRLYCIKVYPIIYLNDNFLLGL